MNTITIDDTEYTLPGTWDELSRKQLIDVCAVLSYYYAIGDTTDAEWRFIREELLKILLDFKRGWFRHSRSVRKFVKLPDEARTAILNHPDILPWLFSKIELSGYPIADITLDKVKYVGPHTDMLDVTVEEMIACHISATLYEATKDEKHLIELIAQIYRPVDPDYRKRSKVEQVPDRRELNSIFEQEERERIFALKLNAAEKMAIYMQYCSHLEQFTKRYPLFFKAVDKKKKKDKVDALPDLESYFLLVKNLSGEKFGTYQETRRASADLFFSEVETKIQATIDAKFNKQ